MAKAVEVREGRRAADEGQHTDELLAAVVARDTDSTARRISHVASWTCPTYHKVLIITDAAINIAPAPEDRVEIRQNAIDLAMELASRGRRSRSWAVETGYLPKMQATIEAAAAQDADRG